MSDCGMQLHYAVLLGRMGGWVDVRMGSWPGTRGLRTERTSKTRAIRRGERGGVVPLCTPFWSLVSCGRWLVIVQRQRDVQLVQRARLGAGEVQHASGRLAALLAPALPGAER